MNIRFKNNPKYDPSRGVLWFSMEANGKLVRCQISLEAMDDCFEAGQDPFESFTENQRVIEQKATDLMLCDCFEDDGSIFIQTKSFVS
jgi:hypothetical protein